MIPNVRIIPPMMTFLSYAREHRRNDVSYCSKTIRTIWDRSKRISKMERIVEREVSMKILIASDSYKGSLSSLEVSKYIQKGFKVKFCRIFLLKPYRWQMVVKEPFKQSLNH